MTELETRKVAVLIDAENVPAIFADQIFDSAGSFGTIVMKEMYGSGPALCNWTEPALRYVVKPNITLRQSKGKNTSDIALTIGAMDLLITDVADDVVIVSSDSDFSALAIRLRTAGKNVIGMGEAKSNAMWKVACTQFITLEQKQITQETQKQVSDVKIEAVPIEIEIDFETEVLSILQNGAHEDGYLALSELLAQLRKKYPKYLPGRRGFDKALSILRSNSRFDVRRENIPGRKNPIFEVREHIEEVAEEKVVPVDTSTEIRNRIARMLEEKNGRMPISAMFPELNTISGYRTLQRKSGKKPQQFIIDNYGDMFRTEDINGGLWTLPIDDEAENQLTVDNTIPVEDTNVIENVSGSESHENTETVAEEQSVETVESMPESDVKNRLMIQLNDTGYDSETAAKIAAIMTENKPFTAYNKIRKQFGKEGGRYYKEAKALMEQP